MKNLYKAFASAAVALLAVSCVNEMANDTTDGLFRKYNLSFDDGTKTELSGSGSTRQVKWNEGDEIKYYTKDKQSSVSTASVSLAGSTAFVEIPRGRSDDFINAVYGAGSLTGSSSTADCMYVTSPAKSDQSYTTFAQAHLCAAFSSDLEDPNLRFHNAVAILKFTFAASISKVVFSGNNGEVITGGSNGSLKISYSGGAVSAEPSSTGGTSVTVTTGGQESDFYIAILPVNFSKGILVQCYDVSGFQVCERRTSGELNTVNAAGLPIIANLGSIQEWLDNPKPTAVDLGLSVKWASFNLGASTPEGSGDYFSWGETAPKSSYSWSTYAYGQSKTGPFSEYVLDPSFGTVDYKTVLDLEDDAAHAIWGDAWRIPSKEEVQELRDNCTWTWTTINGVNGYKVSSSITGNSIFLPAAGMMSGSKVQNSGTEGDYWSSSIYTAESCSSWSPYFTASEFSTGDCYRYFGLGIRPVEGVVVPVASIDMPATLDLIAGGTTMLSATISPGNATYKGLTWLSSDGSVATVDAAGKVTAVSIGNATITTYSADAATTASCEVTVKEAATIPNGYEYIDLGLPSGLKWATMNVGATKPEEYGALFAWGETEPKSIYKWSTYKWCNGSSNSLTKYNTWSSYGKVDNKTVLDPEDDAAHVNWGGSWRMPTVEECDELMNNCTWTWTTQNEVNGRLVTGPNGKSIFLPAAGYRSETYIIKILAGYSGGYWSSSLVTGFSAYGVYFDCDYVTRNNEGSHRYPGQSVRPVTE